eukprot:2768532-Pyramimonas_sp.AAC.1
MVSEVQGRAIMAAKTFPSRMSENNRRSTAGSVRSWLAPWMMSQALAENPSWLTARATLPEPENRSAM